MCGHSACGIINVKSQLSFTDRTFVLFLKNRKTISLPILICEIEGSKDIWGDGEQQSKAIEEVCYALAFIPENYIMFVYSYRFEFVVVKRNPYTGSIDIEREIVYL